MSFSGDARKVLVLLFGLANAGAGGFFLYRTMNVSPVDRHLVYVFVGWIALGALMVAPSTLIAAAKQLFSFLPQVKIGGQQ